MFLSFLGLALNMKKESLTNNYSPLLIFTFNRPEHTKRLFESLFKCELIEETDCIVFCDFPKNKKDYRKNEEVKTLLNTISEHNPFKSFEIILQKDNKGLASSIIYGVSFIINKYNKVIVLEDDLIVSVKFLRFMNDCLNFYETDERIWSISGYSHNLKAFKKYKESIYLCGRSCSWGWATWKNRWNLVDWDVSDYSKFKHNIFLRSKFASWGRDMPTMLDAQMCGENSSWAIRWCYSQFKCQKYTIYPINSFVENIGCDGSGTNFKEATSFYTTNNFDEGSYSLKYIEVNKTIKREFKKHNISTFKSRVYWLFRRLGLIRKKNG